MAHPNLKIIIFLSYAYKKMYYQIPTLLYNNAEFGRPTVLGLSAVHDFLSTPSKVLFMQCAIKYTPYFLFYFSGRFEKYRILQIVGLPQHRIDIMLNYWYSLIFNFLSSISGNIMGFATVSMFTWLTVTCLNTFRTLK